MFPYPHNFLTPLLNGQVLATKLLKIKSELSKLKRRKSGDEPVNTESNEEYVSIIEGLKAQIRDLTRRNETLEL